MTIELDFVKLERIAEPQTFITLVEAKAHCRVDHNDEDVVITNLINVACSALDGEGGLCGFPISEQSWRKTFYPFLHMNEYALEIETPWVKSVESIKYYNEANTLITANLADWEIVINKEELNIWPRSGVWPSMFSRWDAFSVEYKTGIAVIPAEIKHAGLLLIGSFYDNRDDGNFEIPKAVHSLVNLKRKGWIG